VLEVLTTEPGIQFYSGTSWTGTLQGKSGKAYQQRYGFCWRRNTTRIPEQAGIPSTELKPGQHYHTTTIYKFLCRSSGRGTTARPAPGGVPLGFDLGEDLADPPVSR